MHKIQPNPPRNHHIAQSTHFGCHRTPLYTANIFRWSKNAPPYNQCLSGIRKNTFTERTHFRGQGMPLYVANMFWGSENALLLSQYGWAQWASRNCPSSGLYVKDNVCWTEYLLCGGCTGREGRRRWLQFLVQRCEKQNPEVRWVPNS